MSMSERRINEKEDDFFLIEHCKILNRKWANDFETKSFANHAVNKKVIEHSGLFHEYLVKIHKKGAALSLDFWSVVWDS